ncbi:MAG: hypothetical protein L3K13_04155 [Thermoplasmata archaeon]|nr:hypothetical protein [Thermoplasmata archaeon]
MSPEPEGEAGAGLPLPPNSRLGRVTLLCEVCGAETAHRVLRVTPRRTATHLEGIARCAVCHTTHPFRLATPRTTSVSVVVSDAERSHRTRQALAEGLELQVGGSLPGADPKLEIRRLDLRGGARTESAPARDVATVWLTLRRGDQLHVSLIEGRKTTPLVLSCTPETNFSVGDLLRTAGEVLRIHAVRARGQTWDEEGPRFQAFEVDRLYVRRAAERRPARSSGWEGLPEGR